MLGPEQRGCGARLLRAFPRQAWGFPPRPMPILESDSVSWASPWLVSQRSPDRGRVSEKTKPTRPQSAPKDSDSFRLPLATVRSQESNGNADVTFAQSRQAHSPALRGLRSSIGANNPDC